MDLNYSAEETAFRDQVRGWLSENLPSDLRDKAHHPHRGRRIDWNSISFIIETNVATHNGDL